MFSFFFPKKKGHGMCVEFVSKFNVPLLIVGGGKKNQTNKH